MPDCLGKFKDDVDKVLGRHESVLRSLMLFTGAYREVTASDVYIGGLIASNCEVYKYRELGYEEYHGLAGFCGDELFDIENVGQPYLRGLNTVMHEKVYSRLPETSIWLLHDMKERRIPLASSLPFKTGRCPRRRLHFASGGGSWERPGPAQRGF